MVTKTSAEAQNQFGQLLDLVQREPVAITRHGRPAAFIVSPRDMEELMSLKQKRSNAVKALEAWRGKYKDQISPEATKLTDEEINRMVHEERTAIRKAARTAR
jgi:antitoxin Phd